MNSFTLKLIAVITMLIDHTAHVLVSQDTPIYFLMRAAGRLAFPIFCFLIVEGFYHTRNVYKYLLRLGIFALLSEIPFDLAIHGEVFYQDYQNVYFTLFIGLGVICGLEKVRTSFTANRVFSALCQCLIVLAGCMFTVFLKTDYDAMGVILIVLFYLYRENKPALIISVLLVTIFLGGVFEGLASLSLILILLYNGERGTKVKYAFYAFYPVHLFVLYLISIFI